MKLRTKLELHLASEQVRIVTGLLQQLQVFLEVCYDGVRLLVELALELRLKAIDGLLHLLFANLSSLLVLIIFQRHASQQLLHALDEDLVLNGSIAEGVQCRYHLLIGAGLQIHLLHHLHMSCPDTVLDAGQAL